MRRLTVVTNEWNVPKKHSLISKKKRMFFLDLHHISNPLNISHQNTQDIQLFLP